LLTVAIALFGNDSFIATSSNRLGVLLEDAANSREIDGEYEACDSQMPVSPLLPDAYRSNTSNCTRGYAESVETLDKELVAYVGSFFPYGHKTALITDYPGQLTNAFGAAVFLANEAWLVFSRDNTVGARYVFSNPGVEMIIPAISRAGMIVVSSLWAVYIACLLSLAIYSARSPRWTNTLDAFAMMRIGAATKDVRIALKVGFENETIDALNDLPGTIGDASGGDGEIGFLGLGASTPLNGVRLYESYRGDAAKAEPKPVVERPPTHVERDGKFYKIRAEPEPVVERPPTHVEVDGKFYMIQATERP
jgi:hypothetical protein